jgi:hypothetical protein
MTSRHAARYGSVIHLIGATARPSIGGMMTDPALPDLSAPSRAQLARNPSTAHGRE